MDRFSPREGTSAPYWRHMNYIADATDAALRSVLSDYLAVSEDIFLSGAEVSQTPSGTGTIVAVSAGHLCYKGEVMPIDAHQVSKGASQVVYITVQDDGVDIAPVINLDGATDYVMRRRHARLRVGPIYPGQYMSISAPRKADIDIKRLKGRVVPQGGIVPYYGTMSHFDATGLGLPGTPMDGWAVCNGLHGTIDLRGMTLFGATQVPASGAPSIYAGVATASNPGDRMGADQVVLEANQLPEHTHGYLDNQVNFSAAGPVDGSGGGDRTDYPRTTLSNVTTNEPVDVRQSSIALVFIQSLV